MRAGRPVPSSPETTRVGAGQGYSAFVQDAAYKNLFSHPRMVEDLLRGFAAVGWSDALDFESLQKLPAEFVSEDLRRRQGDGLWRVRFRDSRWLYVMVLLEFQSTVDRYMAVRMLVYAGLLHQDLIRRKELGPGGELPPVLPVVLYNGRSRWTAADDVAKLAAPVGEPLARYQPSQRYFLLDARAHEGDDLPRDNLVSALLGLENSRSPEDLKRAARALSEWLGRPGESELKRAFVQWAVRVAIPARLGAGNLHLALAQLEEDPTMLAERSNEWYEEAHERGREQGIEQGRAEERALLKRLAARKFGTDTAEPLAELLVGLTAPGQLAEVGDWIIECEAGAELLDRTGRLIRSSS